MTAPLHPDDEIRVFIVRCAAPFPTDGDYVRRFYMSQVGPTGTALLQLLVAAGPRVWRAGDLACRLGVSARAANHANNPLGRSLDRLTKFRLIERTDDGRIFVRSHLAQLEPHQLSRMCDELRADHDAVLTAWRDAHAGAQA